MYAWEKNWSSSQSTFTVGSPSGTLSARKVMVQRLKNWMVSHAGWTVVASKGFWDGSYYYEYEGVTAGGAYGGDSTGPYDTWSHYGSEIEATRKSWIMLRGPTSSVGTFYVLMGYDGTDVNLNYCFYFGASDQMFLEPVGNELPLPAPGAGYAAKSWMNSFFSGGDNATYYLYFSGCEEDGSFCLTTRRNSHTVVWSGVYLFSTLDTAGASYTNCMPIVFCAYSESVYCMSTDLTSLSGHLANWVDWSVKQNPKVVYPYNGTAIAVATRAASSFQNVGSVDFPFDMDGKVYMYPAHVVRTAGVGYAQGGVGGTQPARNAYVGRMKDFYVAPATGVVKGDVVVDNYGLTKYYYFSVNDSGYNTESAANFKLWIPGTEVPA